MSACEGKTVKSKKAGKRRLKREKPVKSWNLQPDFEDKSILLLADGEFVCT